HDGAQLGGEGGRVGGGEVVHRAGLGADVALAGGALAVGRVGAAAHEAARVGHRVQGVRRGRARHVAAEADHDGGDAPHLQLVDRGDGVVLVEAADAAERAGAGGL